jgi:VanZ family protein
MIQSLYKLIFWIGYLAVLTTACLALPWQLDKTNIGTIDFHIRLDHLLHFLIYILICIYFYAGQTYGLILFRDHALVKFLILIFLLATITEMIQLWVPSRSFNLMDWVSNVSGVAIGLAVILFLRMRQSHCNP